MSTSPAGISVIIPVYNRSAELKRAIASVLAQTYPYFELLVIDDGSRAGLVPEVISQFPDKRLRLLTNETNRGVSFTRNRGIAAAAFDIVAFLDSDDEWKKEKLQRQMAFFETHPHIRVVHTEEIWIRRGQRVNQKKHHRKEGGDIFIRSLELCLMSPSSIMLRKAVFNEYGLFDETLTVCEDYDLWLRITAFEEVGFIETPLIIKYGGHADQLSTAYEAMDKYRVQSLLKILESHLPLPEEKKCALENTLIKKTTILLNGARKRNKEAEIAAYEAILQRTKV